VNYSKLRRYREAIEAYKEAIRIKPDFAEAHYNLGLTYLILGDKGSALDEYRILKDLDKDLANKLFTLIDI
jgi:tetratricopeptide (TPR) repeat protein